jgi:SAM-dependent methyltransferase
MNLCPICKNHKFRVFRKGLYDDRFGYPGRFNLVRCRFCNHVFLDAEFTAEEVSRFYTEYYPRRNYDLAKHRPYKKGRPISDWLNGARSAAYYWVPNGVRILDIGCGTGESLGYFKSIGCSAFGVEADENIRKIADRFGYNIHIGMFDSAMYQENSFDYVTMNQVLEHMADPRKVLDGIYGILRPGGTLIVTIPNVFGWGRRMFGKKWINWHIPYHGNFFSKRSMRSLASATGFRIAKAVTVTPSGWLDFQWYHLLTFPNIGETSAFWMPEGNKSFLNTRTAGFIKAVHRFKINHKISRFFDMLNAGDNFIFILQKTRRHADA